MYSWEPRVETEGTDGELGIAVQEEALVHGMRCRRVGWEPAGCVVT